MRQRALLIGCSMIYDAVRGSTYKAVTDRIVKSFQG